MVEHASQASLVAEALQQFTDLRPLDVQSHGLECDGTANGWIHGFVHYAHGALPKLPYNFITPDFFQSHCCAHNTTSSLRSTPQEVSAAKSRVQYLRSFQEAQHICLRGVRSQFI